MLSRRSLRHRRRAPQEPSVSPRTLWRQSPSTVRPLAGPPSGSSRHCRRPSPRGSRCPKPWRLLSQTERAGSSGPGREINFDFYWETGAEGAFRALQDNLSGKVELIGTVSFSAVYGPNFLVHVNKPRPGDKHLLISVRREDPFAALPSWTGSCQEVSLNPAPDSATEIAAAKPLAPGQSYTIGDTLAHPTWDPGRVVAVDKSTVTIAIPPEDPGGVPFVLACAR